MTALDDACSQASQLSPSTFRDAASRIAREHGISHENAYARIIQFHEDPYNDSYETTPRWRPGDEATTPGMVVDAATAAYLLHKTIDPTILCNRSLCGLLPQKIHGFHADGKHGLKALIPLVKPAFLDDILEEGPLSRLDGSSDRTARLAALGATARNRAVHNPPSTYRDQCRTIASLVGLPHESTWAYSSLISFFEAGGVEDTNGFTPGMLLDVVCAFESVFGTLRLDEFIRRYPPAIVAPMTCWLNSEPNVIRRYAKTRLE